MRIAERRGRGGYEGTSGRVAGVETAHRGRAGCCSRHTLPVAADIPEGLSGAALRVCGDTLLWACLGPPGANHSPRHSATNPRALPLYAFGVKRQDPSETLLSLGGLAETLSTCLKASSNRRWSPPLLMSCRISEPRLSSTMSVSPVS